MQAVALISAHEIGEIHQLFWRGIFERGQALILWQGQKAVCDGAGLLFSRRRFGHRAVIGIGRCIRCGLGLIGILLLEARDIDGVNQLEIRLRRHHPLAHHDLADHPVRRKGQRELLGIQARRGVHSQARVQCRIVNALRMQLVFDPGIQALGQDGVDLAGFRAEGQAVESVECSQASRQSHVPGFRRFDCGPLRCRALDWRLRGQLSCLVLRRDWRTQSEPNDAQPHNHNQRRT